MPLRVSEKEYRKLAHESASEPEPGERGPRLTPPAPQAPKVQPVSNEDGNFWLFTAGGIIALFLLYITKKGELKTWAEILMYNPKPPITVEGGSSGAEMKPDTPLSTPSIGHILSGGIIGTPGNMNVPIAPKGQSVLQYFFNQWFRK